EERVCEGQGRDEARLVRRGQERRVRPRKDPGRRPPRDAREERHPEPACRLGQVQGGEVRDAAWRRSGRGARSGQRGAALLVGDVRHDRRERLEPRRLALQAPGRRARPRRGPGRAHPRGALDREADHRRAGEIAPGSEGGVMEWLTPPVAQVVKVIKGKRPTHVENFPSETAPLPYITIEAFESGSPSQFASARNGEVITEDGDVLIVWDGARFGLVGLSPGGVLGSTLAKLKPLPMLDRKYLYYFLQTQYAYLRSVHRGSGIPHIDASHLGRCRIPLPPLSEQRRIVEILDQADRLRR